MQDILSTKKEDARSAAEMRRLRDAGSFWQRSAKILNKDKYLYALFIVPFLYFFIFRYIPIYGVIIAFKNYKVAKGILGSSWVGIKHFQEFLSNPYAWKLIRNTILLSFYSVLFGFPGPIVLALLINEIRKPGVKRFVQTVSYLPHFISVVVVCGMIVNFVASDGIVNKIVGALGGTPFPWLMDPQWFRPIYIISGIWQHAGWSSIIYLAALSAIDPQLYEAAIIDGASRWRQTLHVTLPGIAPTVTIMLILTLGRMMNVGFEKILLLYTGATYETADVLQTYVYRRGIESTDFSYASAVGLFQGVVNLMFVVLANTVSRRLSETSLW
jgi:putative aldouronate transport system permease protein